MMYDDDDVLESMRTWHCDMKKIDYLRTMKYGDVQNIKKSMKDSTRNSCLRVLHHSLPIVMK